MFKLNLTKRKIVLISAVALFGLVVVVLMWALFRTEPEELKVFNIAPSNGVENVSVETPVDIVFINQVSNDDKEKIDVQVNPDIKIYKNWLTDKQLRLTFLTKLKYNTTYTVKFTYNKKLIGVTKFVTKEKLDEDTNNVPIITKEEQETLVKDALSVLERTNELSKKMPWYFDLPIKGDGYVVMYNTEKASFRISLYIPEDSSQSLIDSKINSALDDLKDIGVNMEKYDYYTIFR